jgi:hypothetical protein
MVDIHDLTLVDDMLFVIRVRYLSNAVFDHVAVVDQWTRRSSTNLVRRVGLNYASPVPLVDRGLQCSL